MNTYCTRLFLSFLILLPAIAYSSDTKFVIGGYIKVDAHYDNQVNSFLGPRGPDLLNYRSIALDGSDAAERPGGTRMHARASRFFFQTNTAGDVPVKTFLEWDFFGRVDETGAGKDDDTLSNAYEPRLRQAYIKYGEWLMGQTWSNFVDLKAYPEGLTFSGVLGRTFMRQTQIRYEHRLNGKLTLKVSAENPDTDYNTGTPAPGDQTLEAESIPDLITTLFQKTGGGHVRASLLVRSLKLDDGVNKDEAIAWGLALSGRFNINKHNSLKWNALGGDGIGRYLHNNHFRSAIYKNGKLETEKAWGGNIGYQHIFSESKRWNIMVGGHTIDNDEDLVASSVNEKIYNFHTNMIWTLKPMLTISVGVTYAKRETEGGDTGDITRYYLAFKRPFKFML